MCCGASNRSKKPLGNQKVSSKPHLYLAPRQRLLVCYRTLASSARVKTRLWPEQFTIFVVRRGEQWRAQMPSHRALGEGSWYSAMIAYTKS